MIYSIIQFKQIKIYTLNNTAYFIKHIHMYLRTFMGAHGRGGDGIRNQRLRK